jgi:hypothetical protein
MRQSLNSMKKPPPATPTPAKQSDEVVLLTQIRDALAARP